jgi:Ribbon-helix-helix protein, copG family
VASVQVNMRLPELDRARLDRLARARRLSRTALVRQLLADADRAGVSTEDPANRSAAPPGAPSRAEALELLADKARGGSVVAMVALERALRLGGEPALSAPVKTGPVRLEELTADELRAVG